jgi:hypothetical protein
VIGNDTDAASVVYAVSAFVDSKHIQWNRFPFHGACESGPMEDC